MVYKPRSAVKKDLRWEFEKTLDYCGVPSITAYEKNALPQNTFECRCNRVKSGDFSFEYRKHKGRAILNENAIVAYS